MFEVHPGLAYFSLVHLPVWLYVVIRTDDYDLKWSNVTADLFARLRANKVRRLVGLLLQLKSNILKFHFPSRAHVQSFDEIGKNRHNFIQISYE